MAKQYFDINSINNIADRYGLWHRTTEMGEDGSVEEYFMPENTVHDLDDGDDEYWRHPLFSVKHTKQDPVIYSFKNLNYKIDYDENVNMIEFGVPVSVYTIDELERYIKRVFLYLKEYQLLQKRLKEIDKQIELEEDFK